MAIEFRRHGRSAPGQVGLVIVLVLVYGFGFETRAADAGGYSPQEAVTRMRVPEGLLDKLPEAQVRDLFKYLQSSRPPANYCNDPTQS